MFIPASSLGSSSSLSPITPRSKSADLEPFREILGSGLAGLSSTELEARLQGQVRIVDYLAWKGGNHTIRSLLMFFRALGSHIAGLQRKTDMNGCRNFRYRCQGGKKVTVPSLTPLGHLSLYHYPNSNWVKTIIYTTTPRQHSVFLH